MEEMEMGGFPTELKEMQAQLFKTLGSLDVKDKTEKKGDLTYLSWCYAWAEFLKVCPDAYYEIRQFEDKDGVLRCYQYDENLGYMVFTSIRANGLYREMWLPVMDGANKAMKAEPYTYTVGRGERAYEKTVEAATMFDINKTIMRCLTKNMAMFGLGLNIYAGEDLPIIEEEPTMITKEQIARIKELNVNVPNVLKKFKAKSINSLTEEQAAFVIATKEKAIANEQGGEQ